MKWVKWGIIKRAIFFIILFFGAISCCAKIPNINSIKNNKNLPVNADQAVVMVVVNLEFEGNETGFGSTGTGFGIAYQEGSTFIMTAGHVCEPLSKKPGYKTVFYIVTIDGKKIAGKETIISKTQDLCLIKVDELIPIIKVAKIEPKTGDKISYSGYPLGVYIPGTLHYFDGYMGGKDIEENHLYNIPAVGGSSGSPIYNQEGELVAVISAVMVDFEHITFAVGLHNILYFLQENGLAIN